MELHYPPPLQHARCNVRFDCELNPDATYTLSGVIAFNNLRFLIEQCSVFNPTGKRDDHIFVAGRTVYNLACSIAALNLAVHTCFNKLPYIKSVAPSAGAQIECKLHCDLVANAAHYHRTGFFLTDFDAVRTLSYLYRSRIVPVSLKLFPHSANPDRPSEKYSFSAEKGNYLQQLCHQPFCSFFMGVGKAAHQSMG